MFPGVHAEPCHLVEDEELLSLCLGVGVCGVRPDQVLVDENPKEPDAADSLHQGPVDGDGGLAFSLLLPVVHHQLLRFADIEMKGC